jgi:N6-adenosine-specific RNA methylase IME4
MTNQKRHARVDFLKRRMPLAEIQALPIMHLAARDCALFCWATAPLLDAASDTIRRWGFTFKSAGAWAKQSATGKKLAFGTGYGYRSAAEFWLLATIGNPKRQSRSVRSLILAPIRDHSRKPDQMRADIERLFPAPMPSYSRASERPDGMPLGGR